jgi:hypothetical protein
LSKDFLEQIRKVLNRYIEKYRDKNILNDSKEWLKNNTYKLRSLFENYSLRDFVLEPFRSVFSSSTKTLNSDIYSVITQVAVINAVLAGLPGKMGVGVAVSMALEAWMAYQIAKHVGIKINNISDIWKYLGVLAATIATILWGVKAALGVAFSLFSVVSGPLNPLIFAELLVTDLLGIGFWAWVL